MSSRYVQAPFASAMLLPEGLTFACSTQTSTMKSKTQEQQKQGWSWHLGKSLKGWGDRVVALLRDPGNLTKVLEEQDPLCDAHEG